MEYDEIDSGEGMLLVGNNHPPRNFYEPGTALNTAHHTSALSRDVDWRDLQRKRSLYATNDATLEVSSRKMMRFGNKNVIGLCTRVSSFVETSPSDKSEGQIKRSFSGCSTIHVQAGKFQRVDSASVERHVEEIKTNDSIDKMVVEPSEEIHSVHACERRASSDECDDFLVKFRKGFRAGRLAAESAAKMQGRIVLQEPLHPTAASKGFAAGVSSYIQNY